MRVVEGTADVASVDEFVSELGDVGDDYGCTVQAFDARYVVDETHLRRALELADRAIGRGENVARERAVEILLYAAGRRQIDRALEMGVDAGETPVVVVVAARPDGDGAADDASDPADREAAAGDAVGDLLDPAETLGDYDEDRVVAFFDVTPAERDATDASLADLVHERVALLDVEK
jgi:KEOPS complex subunit Cgi121